MCSLAPWCETQVTFRSCPGKGSVKRSQEQSRICKSKRKAKLLAVWYIFFAALLSASRAVVISHIVELVTIIRCRKRTPLALATRPDGRRCLFLWGRRPTTIVARKAMCFEMLWTCSVLQPFLFFALEIFKPFLHNCDVFG